MRYLGLLLVLVTAFAASAANAQDSSIFTRGEAVVTGFSGTKAADPPPASGDPLDETFIDLDGPSAQILKLEPGTPPMGELITAPAVLSLRARDIGQVFAIELDDGLAPDATKATPNIYLGATSAYGLQIVLPDSDNDGRPERARKGEPNAQWMAGQFGLDRGGGPGSIYRVDGKTGGISLFATIPNSGPGLGDIAFDRATRQFFVSDLDTGLIHRLDATGQLIDTFDHGLTGRPAGGLPAVADDGVVMDINAPAFDAENSSTWGFTQPERRVWGVGFRAGRLYYTAGIEIWSVSINLDGTFGGDPRREIEVSGTPNNHPISDITFDNQDHMYVAQRGGIEGSYDYSVFADTKQSVVFRFKREIPDDPATPGIWVPVPDEYAVGFPPDYRNTSGGVALGYGYDEAGAIRPGACDMTLWSSGDSLLDSTGSVVHGLQGNNRTLTRPDNEPPSKSYFADYDGRVDDAREQGHVGDVEIWQPCGERAEIDTYEPAAELPPDFIPPFYVPPGETPPDGWEPDDEPPIGTPGYAYNLRLDKKAVPNACSAGGLGFLCDYIVRVTNVGPDTYFGPIIVNDSLPAAPAGAVMTVTNAPPWFCLPISPGEQQCTYAPGVLDPGESIDLFVTVDLAVAAPMCSLDNIAGLVWPPGFGDIDPTDDFDFATATIPAGHCLPPVDGKTNLLLTKDPFAKVCTDKGNLFECRYLVIARNVGAGIYNGPVKIEDTIPAGATALFPQASWNCAGPAPTYSCETAAPVVLLPGQAVNLNTVVKVPKNQAAALKCEAENNAKIVAAPGGSDQNTDATDDEADAIMILPGKVADCPDLKPMSNLKLKKTGPPGICPVVGKNWECPFKITVQNFGKAYTNDVQFFDALPFGTPAGATISFQPPAGWTCGGPFFGLYQCKSDNPNLPHLAKAEITATVKVPVAPVAKCEIKNNATIVKAPGGTLLNSFAGDDASSAKAKLAAVFPLNGDPPICLAASMQQPEKPPLTAPRNKESNLTIAKTAAASTATASGQNTKFTITVTNEGPGVFKAPIEIKDTLFDGQIVEPSNGSWSAPWTCEGQSAVGHPEQGICTHPEIELDPGEGVDLNIEIEAPNSFVAPSGSQVKCGWKNKVEITRPAGGSPKNTNAGDDTAFAEAKFAPFEKHGTTFCGLGLTTPPAACPQGWSKTPVAGKCCPPNSGWDGERCKRDVKPPEEKECPANSVGTYPDCRCKSGYTGTPPNCRKVEVPQDCKGGMVRVAGECRCPEGLKLIDGKCRTPSSQPKTCGPNEVGKYPDCRCARGFTGEPPYCKPAVCPPGTTGKYPNCRKIACESNKEYIDGACRCRYPLKWNGKRCVTDVPKTCPADSIGKYPNCRCKRGTAGVPGECKRIVPEKCPKGFTGTPPNCVPQRCPRGFTGTPPNCERVVPKRCPADSIGQYPNCRCKRGTVGEPGNCTRVVPERCPRGFTGTPPNCERIFRPCPTGFTGTPPDCKRIVIPQLIIPLRRVCPTGMTGVPPDCKRRGEPVQ